MKKLLLMLVAFVATMSASAQTFITDDDMTVENGWAATFTPVADDDEIDAAMWPAHSPSPSPLQARHCPTLKA